MSTIVGFLGPDVQHYLQITQEGFFLLICNVMHNITLLLLELAPSLTPQTASVRHLQFEGSKISFIILDQDTTVYSFSIDITTPENSTVFVFPQQNAEISFIYFDDENNVLTVVSLEQPSLYWEKNQDSNEWTLLDQRPDDYPDEWSEKDWSTDGEDDTDESDDIEGDYCDESN